MSQKQIKIIDSQGNVVTSAPFDMIGEPEVLDLIDKNAKIPYLKGSGNVNANSSEYGIALGPRTLAYFNSVSIGGGANTENSSYSIAIGDSARASGTNIPTAGGVVVGYAANASKNNSIAIGRAAFSNASDSVVIGNNAKVPMSFDGGVAIGSNTCAGWQGTAIGFVANAYGSGPLGGVAVGRYANACYDGVAIGPSTNARYNSIAIGQVANTLNSNGQAVANAIAIGYQAKAQNNTSIAIGPSCCINGDNSANTIAIGPNVKITNSINVILIGQNVTLNDGHDAIMLGSGITSSNAVAIGTAATASANCVAIGRSASAVTVNSIVIGACSSSLSYMNSTVIGYRLITNSSNSMKIGSGNNCFLYMNQNSTRPKVMRGTQGEIELALLSDVNTLNATWAKGSGTANATGSYSVAIGSNANASGSDTAAVGSNAAAPGSRCTALGQKARTGASSYSVAVGNNANAYSSQCTSIGDDSTATGAQSTAVGASSHANYQYSIAIGYMATCNAANQITLGGTQINMIRAQVTTISSLSDRRLKMESNKVNTALCLDNINKLPVRRFHLVNGVHDTAIDKTRLGFYAQEVEQIYPRNVVAFDGEREFDAEHVTEEEKEYLLSQGAIFFNKKIPVDKSDPKSKKVIKKFFKLSNIKELGFEQATPTMWGAIQELSKMVRELQEEITTLKKSV